MKKSSRVLGTLAVSAALVMGTAVPAFADTLSTETDASGNSENGLKQAEVDSAYDSGSAGTAKGAAGGYSAIDTTAANRNYAGENSMAGASTVINVSTYTSQISVTVPLFLPIQLDTAGGVGYAPTNGKYYIQNNSTIAVSVAKADYAVTKDSNDWNFGPQTLLSPADDSDRNVIGTPDIGSIFMRITPQAPTSAEDATLTDLTGATKLTLDGNGVKNGTKTLNGWTVSAAADTSTPTKLPMKVEAASSTLKKSVEETVSKAAGIVYTVQKAVTA